MLKKSFLNCLISPVLVIFTVLTVFTIIGTHDATYIDNTINTFIEPFTYCCYAFALGIMISHLQPYKTQRQKIHVSLFFILFVCAILREMGIQHWLTTTDTTAFKLRFFTNPNNPLSEKITAALILLIVISIIAYLLIYYLPKIIKGFFKLNPLYWTIATFGGTGIICKIADRLPGNLRKAGHELTPQWKEWFELFEETTELCLPLICAIGFIQFAQIACSQKNNQKK